LHGRKKRKTGSARLAAAVAARLKWAGVLANGIGSLIVFFFAGFLIPGSIERDEAARIGLLNGTLATIYLVLTLKLGVGRMRRRLYAPLERWLREERPATEEEQALALRYPLNVAATTMFFWGVGAVLFSLLNMSTSVAFALSLGVTLLLGGVTTCALGYLMAERILRPVITIALDGGPPPRLTAPGVTARLTMAWALATGMPLFGMATLAVADLVGANLYGSDETTIAGATLFLAGLALAVGLLAMVLAARSVADPIAAVRKAFGRVERGDYEARVPVDDGSEVGLLEAGFNRMAAGLEERERLRDLFGRHVGRDVALAALDGQAGLGGEVREVAVLFTDLIGSTSLAAERPPTEVVGLLNEFFQLVVETCEHHGGWVNKFEGDAALCVFGAPATREDPAADALAAARNLRERLARELQELEAGIGVSAGAAVAGNIGAEERFEYTVIGDPVNEAARLCELAKSWPQRLLASEAAITRADGSERGRWQFEESVTLRGRRTPTRIATPAPGVPAA
jgi:adenylate cyclase